MKVSIWWLVVVFYAGLFGGIFVVCACRQFKRSDEAASKEGSSEHG